MKAEQTHFATSKLNKSVQFPDAQLHLKSVHIYLSDIEKEEKRG